MKCPVCNQDNGPGINFCEGCGRRIPRCPTCGVELTSRDRFCSNDGTRLPDDLLILVPEESILQEPVWVQPQAPAVEPQWDAPIPDDIDEGTLKAGPEPVKPEPPISPLSPENDSEETVRVTATSGGRGWQQTPPIRNSDPVAASVWDQIDVKPQPPQRAFCENCGKRVAPGNRYCTECRAALRTQTSASSEKPKKKTKLILVIILVILLLLGLAAGGYALVNSDLFDWDSTSSNRNEKDDEEDEEETEEDTSGESEPEDPTAESSEPVAGVVDPVNTEPSQPAPTEPEETTEPTTTPEEDPLLYWLENCDKKYLTAEDLEGFDAKMCSYARNACYAKSGRKFNSSELKQYFSQFDWYHPTVSPENFNNSMLNTYQTANISVVLEYERAHGYNQ